MKIKNLPIYKHINNNFRSYALYTLESRGIPNWYDSLTNVQRIAIINAPKSFSKTISLVGECIKQGYHHGDISLGKSISRLTKTFGNSESIFLGDGFFGSPVNPSPASPRYTSLKMNPKVDKLISTYSHLNERVLDTYQPLHTEVPIGLFNHIIGIAIGWKTSVLPRKMDDIKKYINGEISSIKPYFQNFDGKIEKVKDTKKTWVISSKLKIDDATYSVEISDIPHMLKYSKFIEKLYQWTDETGWNVTIKNDSNEKVKIYLQLRNNRDKWREFCSAIDKMSKVLVTETLIFIKDNRVIEYNCIEDYLDDYKVWYSEILYKNSNYKISVNDFEISYHKAKVDYLKFMMEKKRKDDEIEWFISQYGNSRIKDRLKNIKLNQLSEEEIARTLEHIKELEAGGIILNKEHIDLEKDFKEKSTWEFKGIVAKKEQEKITSSDELDGIDEWDVDEDDDISDFSDDEGE